MDAIVKSSLLRLYMFCHDQLLLINVTLPAPEHVSTAVNTIARYASAYTPENAQVLYAKLMSMPIQGNILPAFLALVVLYLIFSAMLFAVRGIVRLIYGFVRFSVMIALLAALLYTFQQYMLNESGLSLPVLLGNLFAGQQQPKTYQQQQPMMAHQM